MSPSRQAVEQWYHFPMIAGQVFTLIGVHFLSVPQLLIWSGVVHVGAEMFKYLVVSSYDFLYLTIGHSVIQWIATLVTAVLLATKGQWLTSGYVVSYILFMNLVTGLPAQLLGDTIATRLTGGHPKLYGARRLLRGALQ